ncbi:MAG: hypothetical protein SPL39_04090 [Selenomonadaceae bacterium]|nr:hypothetical protein [Selenomonadaceae bacterium]
MKKRNVVLAALLACLAGFSNVEAADAPAAQEPAVHHNPTCVLMKFTDDTRFKNLDSADRFSDLVMDKLVTSQKFNLKETKPIAQDMEKMLYDERQPEYVAAKSAMESGDFSAVFESPAFADQSAQSIATAEVGQTVMPSLTSKIGKDHDAEYLLQGTIQSIGTGTWMDTDYNTGKAILSTALNYIPGLGGFGGIFGSVINNSSQTDAGVGVIADMRVIKADTGEVVWSKRETGRGKVSNLTIGGMHTGSTEASEKELTKALDKVAKKLVDDLVDDLAENKLFLH